MNVKLCLGVVVSLVVGGLIGFSLGAMGRPSIPISARDTGAGEELSYYRVSHATLSVMAFVNLLKGFRAGEEKLMMDRLESFVDMAVMDLARDYSPAWDPYGTASKQLQAAKEYRKQYPYPNAMTNIVTMIDAALQRKDQRAQ